ncbi:uncharacterized protein LOC120084963 [Benincasa hispida]|uniref:uncharacterized protein LOC120084963 n=1 Tax=Benincasa hispida TaxID=102211 RepID=UPI001900AE7D|nr:uncharacterized protein LOC120084963 [Benincasa hispida]
MSKSLKIREVDRFLGQVTCMAHVANANKIVKQKLTERQLEMFKRTVFGRFLDIELVFNSPLIHHMLLREVKNSGMDSISFFVRGKVVTFSKDDFFVDHWFVRVGRSEKSSHELFIKCFGSRLTSDAFHLHLLQEEYKELVFENDEDAVKITLAYYTKVAMMGKNKQKNAMDHTLFDDVEDIDYYNSLDWDLIIWQRTLDFLKTALKDKTKVKESLVMFEAEKEFRDASIDRRAVRQAHSDTESSGSSSSPNSDGGSDNKGS